MLAILVVCLCITEEVCAEPVDLELAFINDVSGSITAFDYQKMREGYARAFRDPSLVELIKKGRHGAIAVSLTVYAHRSQVIVDWMRIDDEASAARFAAAAERARRPSRSSVGIEDGLADAIRAAVGSFDNLFEGDRRVIDVVTEGAETVRCSGDAFVCPAVQQARDAAIGQGVSAINALFLDDRNNFGDDRQDTIQAVPYGERNLVKGEGSFSMMVEDFTLFAEAIKSKIEREVAVYTPPPVICCH